MTLEASAQLVVESYIESVLYFIHTDRQLRQWNRKIQSKIKEAERTGDPELDDLIVIKEKVNRELYERRGKDPKRC